MISSRGRYALQVMIDLAQHADGTYIPLKEVAQRQKISKKYIEAIMTSLSKANLVDAAHGKGGGFRLNKAASEYTAAEILRVTEDGLAPVACLEADSPCERAASCLTLPVWEGLNGVINDYLEGVTLQSLLPQEAQTGEEAGQGAFRTAAAEDAQKASRAQRSGFCAKRTL